MDIIILNKLYFYIFIFLYFGVGVSYMWMLALLGGAVHNFPEQFGPSLGPRGAWLGDGVRGRRAVLVLFGCLAGRCLAGRWGVEGQRHKRKKMTSARLSRQAHWLLAGCSGSS